MLRDWLYTTDERGQTPLNRIFRSSHMALTELLLRREAEDRAMRSEGASALHKAAYLGLHHVVTKLLCDGADPDIADKHGETPLHKAVRQGHEETVRVLVEAGANVNAADLFGLTPLHWVGLYGNPDMAELLLAHGGDPQVCGYSLDNLRPTDLAKIMEHEDVAAMFDGAYALRWTG